VPPREPESRLSPPPVLGELVLTDAGGREHAAPLAGLQSEESGGLRHCWRGRGPLGDSTFSWEARAHVYRGLPWARVLLTFGHDVSNEEFTTLRSLAWRLPVLRGDARYVRQLTDSHFDSSWSNFLLFDGMAYAYRLTQQAGRPDARLAEHLRKGTAPAIQAMSGMGKSFSQFIRVTPHLMGVLAELADER